MLYLQIALDYYNGCTDRETKFGENIVYVHIYNSHVKSHNSWRYAL